MTRVRLPFLGLPARPLTRLSAHRLLIAILLLGALVRLRGVNWDEGHHLHPDERFISMTEEKLKAPPLLDLFDSQRSSLNPYNLEAKSFVYGTFPMFLTKAVASAIGQTGYGRTHLVGRVLSALFDLLTVFLVYRLTRRFAARGAGLLAAGLFAFAPLAVQSSHFWTAETFLTAFTVLAILLSVRLAQGKAKLGETAALGAAIGAAVGCKITALALLAPAGLGALVLGLTAPADGAAARGFRLARAMGRYVLVMLATAVGVRVFLPYAFAGPSPLSFRPDPRWIADIQNIARLSSSVAGFPPALQWAGRTVLWPLRNFVFFGAGPFLAIPALLGLAWAAWQLVRAARALKPALFSPAADAWSVRLVPRLALAPVVFHCAFIAAYHSFTLVKSIRYYYPIYPLLAVLAALFLVEACGGASSRAVRALPWVAFAGTLLLGVGFSSIYGRPVTRVAAADWIFANVKPPAAFANEAWDDGLPMGRPGHDPGPYAGPVLTMFDPDSAEKVQKVLVALREADWIAVTSNRVYANVTRVPDVFPMSIAYYKALFEERLGFKLAAEFTSYPSFLGIPIVDDSAEEQFTVYDHPRVLLFEKQPDYSEERARQILMAAIPFTPPTMNFWELMPRSRRVVTDPVRPQARPERRPKLEVKKEEIDNRVGPVTGSVAAALGWYLALLATGAVAFPLAWRLFSRFADRGFGLSRALGTVLGTFLLVVLVTAGVLANGRAAAYLCLLAVAAASFLVLRRDRTEMARFLAENRRALLRSELVFLAGFALFLGFRALNPEITWGEKPMDFSILNILQRTRSFPSSDPWLSGFPLGYYVFGQQMVVFLTHLTGLDTRLTFNLAFGFLGGTIFQGAYALARAWSGTAIGGLAGTALFALLGNLSGLRIWLTERKPKGLPLDWHYFWATSRVVKDTINEYPFWSLVFADLHAHVLVWPVFLLVASTALQLARLHADPESSRPARLGMAVMFGLFVALHGLTNAWDVPFLLGLVALVALVVLSTPGTVGARLVRAAGCAAAALVTAVSVALPLWARGGGKPGIGLNGEPPASAADVFTCFGLFFFLALAWWLRALWEKLAVWNVGPLARAGAVAGTAVLLAALTLVHVNLFLAAGVLLFLAAGVLFADAPEDRLAFGFVAAGFFLVLFAQRYYIYDRMNTFFKLYLEAWVVLALACAALLFRPAERTGSSFRWPAALKGVGYLLVVAALFTTVTGGHGALTAARPTLRGVGTTTLDGLRFLSESNPAEYRAALWLRTNVKGTPVILEAHGPSYQEFGRVSMLTGLPTVLGWDYHVKQRGNPPEEIDTRAAAVEEIYTSSDIKTVERLLRQYHVGYVYSGWLEKQTYGRGVAKLDANPQLFALVYENPQAKIYRVVGGDAADVTVVAREKLPKPEEAPAPPGGGPVDEPEERPELRDTPEEGAMPFGGMKEPRDGAADPKGRLFIADFGHNRVKVFDPSGGLLGGWGGRGGGTYNLKEPCAVAIRGENVYVADTWNGRVQGYSLSGEWKATAGGLYGPRGVAVDPHGRVFVSDTGNSRVVLYDQDLKQLAILGTKGNGHDQLLTPIGIAAGPDGSVYVCDVDNKRVQILDEDGKFRGSFPAPWATTGEPAVEVDARGNVYVTDPAGSRVVVYDRAGAQKVEKREDDDGRKLNRPMGLALDESRGLLYVINGGSATVGRVKLLGR